MLNSQSLVLKGLINILNQYISNTTFMGDLEGLLPPPPFDFFKKCIHKNSYFPFGAYEFSIHMERMSKESDVEKYVKILF